MKRAYLFLILLILVPTASAATVMDIMENTDEYYYLVLGDNSLGGDISSATEIVLGLLKHNLLDVKTVLEGEISVSLPQILVGPPCGSDYMKEVLGYDCDLWPYEEGQAIIKVDGNNLIVTGTTPDDRRRAGLILKNYPDYPLLDEHSFILVSGMSLEPANLDLEKAKEESEFICGDGVCDPGETFLCFPDCNKKSCFEICNEEGFGEAFCRDVPTNPNVNICQDGEVNKGFQYCTSEKSCCCEPKTTEESVPIQVPQQLTVDKESFIDSFLKGEAAGLIVTMSLIIVGFIILLAFILTR
ncbi:hypothetical protein HOF78_02810 [Candidatus Woesearchaeota archaeon]|jgi:hypothetical protein|nr:hypothetical protein [Candidatus Woesearchaeota archaeon]MBT6044666.1 hypothetical protein [Candidatus Woesearchaeota archaeon]